MEEKILKIFRERRGDFVSGAELGKLTGISRAAIWKHIEKLRQMGYQIVAQPHLGYHLLSIPDKMLPDELQWELGTKVIGRRIISYESTGSTNDVAEQLAAAGAPEGTVVFAERQTRGRGRMGRQWLSAHGKSLLFSFILRPAISTREASCFTLMTAVAASLAVRRVTGLSCLIKWPNDLIVHGRKLGGILTELNAEVERVKFLVIGAGINVNADAEALPRGATSVMLELKKEFSRLILARELLREIEKQYFLLQGNGFSVIIGEGKDLSATLGRRVRVETRNEVLEGQAIGVDEDGALIVREDTGFNRRIVSGDVILVRGD